MTHAKLSSGQQTAQIAHAVADFALHRGESFANWHRTSQFIVSLQTPCTESLEALLQDAHRNGFDTVVFREPDLEDELTAVAFVPNEAVKKYLRKLPLAGKHHIEKN